MAEWQHSRYISHLRSMHRIFPLTHLHSEPGKRFLVLGVNGFGNLAGVFGSQLYKQRYAPEYLLPSYITLGFVAVALVGYVAYRFTLQAVNRRKMDILAGKSPEEIEGERVNVTRYADRKWTFIYGL